MSNVLWSEYCDALAPVAAKWGADGGFAVDRKNAEACWVAPLRGVTVTLTLRMGAGAMRPEVKVGSCSLPTGDAHLARRVMADAIETIERAEAALVEVSHYRVWFRDCPCCHCSGRGQSRGVTCKVCHGKGVRNEAADATGGDQ